MKLKETEFILPIIEAWSNRFSGVRIRYAYDIATDYHIVEVDPESIRRGNDEYKNEELSLYLEFMKRFPESCLLISKPCDAYDMTNLLYENIQQKEIVNVAWVSIQDFFIFNPIQVVWRNVSSKSQYNDYKEMNCIFDENNYALAA